MTHEFLSIYTAKNAEYLLAVGYMMAFVGWWKFVNGGKRAALEARAEAETTKAAEAAIPAKRPEAHGWFEIPTGVWLHPGHTWARAADDGSVTIGVDDFAQKLVGPVSQVALPKPGAPVAQGVPVIALAAGDRAVPMLSPVDGVVSEVNKGLAEDPTLLSDPYTQGWLFKVRPARLQANTRQLMEGESARLWLDNAAASLAARLSPELGHVLQDGGAPVSGIAQELEPERWDALARKYFLT
jgi:glycine cleavage system H lipoate-binding protein